MLILDDLVDAVRDRLEQSDKEQHAGDHVHDARALAVHDDAA